jgi:hypothetical protein
MKRLIAIGSVAVAVVFSVSAIPLSASADSGDHQVGGVSTDVNVNTTAQLDAYVASDVPKTVVLDAVTGEITAVHAGEPSSTASAHTAAAIDNPCTATDLCLIAQVPYADWGFHTAGKTTGSWGHIYAFDTNSWKGKVKASGGVYTNVWIGKNTYVTLSAVSTIVGVKLQA